MSKDLFFGDSDCPRCHRPAGRGHKCMDVCMAEAFYSSFKGERGKDDLKFQEYLKYYRKQAGIKTLDDIDSKKFIDTITEKLAKLAKDN